MRRNFLTSAAALATATGLALTLTACGDSDDSAAPAPEDVMVPVTDTATESPETGAVTADPDPTSAAAPTEPAPDPVNLQGGSTGDTGRSKIFQNSEGFEFLETPGIVMPGGKYTTNAGSSCSFGWMVHPENDNSRLLNLTAGHCGEVGDKVYVRADGQNAVNVGEIVWQAYSGSDGQVDGGPDYALIEIYSEYFEYAFATPAVNMGSTQVELKGWAGKDWLEENQPYMCRLGFRSGLSCGNFQKMTNDISVTYDAISDHGDSGGVVWAFDPSDSSQTSIYAVGVTSWQQYEDATTAGAKTVESPMNAQDLGLYAF